VAVVLASGRGLLAAPVLVLQGLLDLFFWGHPKLLWNDVSGSAAFFQGIDGHALANLLPAWDPASPHDLQVSGALLIAWAALTVLLARR
jgi:hypothetical protein